MAKNEIDPARRQAAIAVVKQHPGLLAFLATPALIATIIVWMVAGTGWGILLLVAFAALGAVGLSRLLRGNQRRY